MTGGTCEILQRIHSADCFPPVSKFIELVNPARASLFQDTAVFMNQTSGLFHIPFEYTSGLLSGHPSSKRRGLLFSCLTLLCIYLIKLQQKPSGASGLAGMRVGL